MFQNWRLLLLLTFCLATCVTQGAAQEPADALSGFSSSELFDITDGRVFRASDPALARLLFRAQQSSRTSLRRFSAYTRGKGLHDVRKQPRDFRCHVFLVSGRARWLQQVKFEDGADSSDQSMVLVHVAVDADQDCLVVVPGDNDNLGLPRRWQRDTPIDEPVTFTGFFLAIYDFYPDANEKSIWNILNLKHHDCPVFVAKWLQWYPDPDSAVPVSKTELLLAKQGVDIGKLEQVSSSANGTIRREDSVSFYQMLAASRFLTNSQIPESELVDFKDCLRNAEQHQNRPMRLQGVVRQATKVKVVDPWVTSEFELDHYYQLQLFVGLDDHEIVVQSPGGAGSLSSDEVIRHANRFPITVCTVELPMATEQIEGTSVSIAGFFFKLWNYESELSRSKTTQVRQISPLVISLTPQPVEDEESPLNMWIGIGAVLVILGLGFLFWIYGPGDKLYDNSSLRPELPKRMEDL